MDIITLALCKRMGKSKADIDGVYPNLIAGGVVESEVRDEDFSNKVTEHTGTAYINSIKGNTLVWNQLIEKGNMTDGWTFSNSTGSYANNILTFTASAQGGFVRPDLPQPIISGHKYLGTVDVKGTSAFSSNILFVGRSEGELNSVSVSTTWQTFAKVFTNTVTENNYFPRVSDRRSSGWDAVQVRNCMLIDLTQMGLDSLTVDEFTSLFPLSYYSYESGKLLPFTGTGIKTVGFNQWDEEWEDGDINITTGQNQEDSSYWRSTNYIPVLPNKQYYVYVVDSTASTSIRVRLYGSDKQYIGSTINGNYVVPNVVFTVPNDVYFIRFAPSKSIYPTGSLFCINISSSKNGTYEPYKEEALSLPIATYFPTGMKRAGNVYDELTPIKATTRIGAVDLGTLTWAYAGTNSSEMRMYTDGINSLVKPSASTNVKGNLICALYPSDTSDATYLKQTCIAVNQTGRIFVYDPNYNTTSSPSAFKTAMDGVYLYYELATETEVGVNLDLSYKTYEGGTEQLLPENGSVPVTSPMKTNVEFDFDENINALLDKMLNMIAPVETSPTSNAYTVGQYLIYDYVLYKVTSAIASGGTITVGTNVEATTIASVLESL